ncbi:MAG: hypothetical protein HYX79_08940 [Chloroflexi bacterium]|nr:hypothetical protein [Chloroflexota bacterium]
MELTGSRASCVRKQHNQRKLLVNLTVTENRLSGSLRTAVSCNIFLFPAVLQSILLDNVEALVLFFTYRCG